MGGFEGTSLRGRKDRRLTLLAAWAMALAAIAPGLGLAPTVTAEGLGMQVVFEDAFETGGWKIDHGAWRVEDGELRVLASSCDCAPEDPGIGPAGLAFQPPFRLDFDMAFLGDDMGTYAGRHAGVFLANQVGNRQDPGASGYAVGYSSAAWGGYRFQQTTDGQVSDVSPTLEGPTMGVGEWRHWSVLVEPSRLVLYVDGTEVGVQSVESWEGPLHLTFWTGTFGNVTAFDNVIVKDASSLVLFEDGFAPGSLWWDATFGPWWKADGTLRVLASSCDCGPEEPDIGPRGLFLQAPFQVDFDIAFLTDAGWFAGKHAGLLIANSIGNRQQPDLSGYAIGYADRWGAGGTGYHFQRFVDGIDVDEFPTDSRPTPEVGEWHHWTLTVHPDQLQFMVDGAVVGTYLAEVGVALFQLTLWTGTNGGVTAFDNFVVRDTTPMLTADQVRDVVREDGNLTRSELQETNRSLHEVIGDLAEQTSQGFRNLSRQLDGMLDSILIELGALHSKVDAALADLAVLRDKVGEVIGLVQDVDRDLHEHAEQDSVEHTQIRKDVEDHGEKDAAEHEGINGLVQDVDRDVDEHAEQDRVEHAELKDLMEELERDAPIVVSLVPVPSTISGAQTDFLVLTSLKGVPTDARIEATTTGENWSVSWERLATGLYRVEVCGEVGQFGRVDLVVLATRANHRGSALAWAGGDPTGCVERLGAETTVLLVNPGLMDDGPGSAGPKPADSAAADGT